MNLTSFHNLLHAYYQCRTKKRLKPSSAAFEFYMEKGIIELERKLQDRSYSPQKFSVFVVTEPKIREIFAAGFSDRVVHHLLVNYLLPIFEPKFIFDSFACRVEKGTHFAIERLSRFLRQATLNNHKKIYYLQADIESFFPSIKHDILFDIIEKQVKNPYILWLTRVIIYHDCTEKPIKKGQLSLFSKVPAHKSLFYVPKGQGLPIGNLTSQFFANVYLNELDQYVKRVLHARWYARYMDDFLIIHSDKTYLHSLENEIALFLKEKLHLDLSQRKVVLSDVKAGVPFVGYRIFYDHILVRGNTLTHIQRKLKKREKAYKHGSLSTSKLRSSKASVYGHIHHSNGFYLRQKMKIWR